MGAELIPMRVGMWIMARREDLLFLGVMRRMGCDMIGRMVFPVSDITLLVLPVWFTGMLGSAASSRISLLSRWHTLYCASFFKKSAMKPGSCYPEENQVAVTFLSLC